jgi:hypothetical protein
MAVLTATNGNVQVAAGDLNDVPAAAFTVAAVFYRAGTTTDGFEALLALATAGGQVITNMGADAAASPYEVSFAQGGATRVFGFDDLVDDDAYLFVVRKTAGTATPRGNLYRFDAGSPGWDGWADGNDTVEDRSDTIATGWLMNQPGGFPWNGGLYVAAWWDDALSEAAITNGSTGLHIGVQQWLDLDPVALWRPGETDPVEDESTAGTSDETSSASVTVAAGDPTGFAMDFGGATVTGSAAANLGALTATATGKRTVYGSAAANLGALTAAATGTRGVRGQAVADLGALTASAAGKRTVYGASVANLGALTATASDGVTVPGSGPRVVSTRPPGRLTASRTPGRLTASRPGGRL